MILTPSRAVRVFAYPAAADLRKGYDGLYGLVQNGLKHDPMSGDLFLFVNESRKLCKVLLWDCTGPRWTGQNRPVVDGSNPASCSRTRSRSSGSVSPASRRVASFASCAVRT